MVILICLEDGKECRKSVGVHEACMMALKQDMARTFGGEDTATYRIIGVESGDDDNFIGALLEGSANLTPEKAAEFIQVDNDPEWDERQLRESYKRRRESETVLDAILEPIKEVKLPKVFRM